ncbi:MAG: hypothetical protein ABWY06_25055 [Pseudomonas sp.]|uniref:hypothetical protein n=1 Tax=Pseudomonas sp. TaxID=306 RepID=UPI00339A9CD5
MRTVVPLIMIVLLTGCAAKSYLQQWQGGTGALTPHAGPVCLLTTPLSPSQPSTLIGRAVASKFFGGFAETFLALANTGRQSGADAIIDMSSRYRPLLIPRAQAYGMAVKLAHPESFNCTAAGGKMY